jgi:hypothetical protein
VLTLFKLKKKCFFGAPEILKGGADLTWKKNVLIFIASDSRFFKKN